MENGWSLNQSEFKRFIARDGHCVHCGDVETIVPNHRANRGMGGSRVRDVPSNIVVLCARQNTLIESDPVSAQLARHYGWKLQSWQNPLEQPVFDAVSGQWFLLDNSYSRTLIEGIK